MRNFPGFGRAAATLALVATVPACGGAGQQLSGVLTDAQQSRYEATCRQRSEKQAKELTEGAYNPAVVFVHKWPGNQTETLLPEARLSAALEAGDIKRFVVIARGGLGKSRLGESLRAQLCGVLPTFLVDLKDIAAKPEDALIAAIAKDAGVADRAGLAKDLTGKRFLVLLDAIEEVDLPRRAAVMAEVANLGKQFPQVQIALLERPPVLDADYGFSHADAVVEIPPLECKVTEAFIAREFPSGPDRLRFEQFLKRFGLDEKAQFGLQCVHPYLSTYRDIQTMAAFEKKALAPEGAARVSPAAVYEALVGARLQKEFAQLNWGQPEALDMVDRLVRMQTSTKGQHSLLFDLTGCAKAIDAKWGTAAVDAGVEGDDAARRRAVCEKTFQSALFQRAQGVDSWVFADRNTTDLFEARWLNSEVARTPAGDCKVIAERGDLLANPGVLRFFAGQPFGQRCLGHTVAALCAKGEAAATLADTLDLGLPAGQARSQALLDARAQATNLGQGACVSAVLDTLDKTVAH
jgi:hypothetical protein